MAYLIIDTDGKVVGERFIAVPPAVQQAFQLSYAQRVVIDGVETKVYPLAYATTVLNCDVAYLTNDNKIELLKR